MLEQIVPLIGLQFLVPRIITNQQLNSTDQFVSTEFVEWFSIQFKAPHYLQCQLPGMV